MDKSLGSQCKTIFEFYQLFYSQTTGSFTATETPWISWSLIGQKCELRGLKVKSFKFIFWTDYSLFIKTVPASNFFHLITVFEKDYIILFIFQLMKLKKVLYNWVSWLYFSIIYHHFTLFSPPDGFLGKLIWLMRGKLRGTNKTSKEKKARKKNI